MWNDNDDYDNMIKERTIVMAIIIAFKQAASIFDGDECGNDHRNNGFYEVENPIVLANPSSSIGPIN